MSIWREGYRVACLRLPSFPLQWLYREQPQWRGEKVAWIEAVRPDAPLRYLSFEAEAVGLSLGMRYATALGLVPDLFVGTCQAEQLAVCEEAIFACLRRFSPGLRRAGASWTEGVYFLEAHGLSLAFGGMESWGRSLLQALFELGWEAVLALGYTSFPCELATLQMTAPSLHLFGDRGEEERQTLRLPLARLGCPPSEVSRLERFGLRTLEDLLTLEVDEVRRFGPQIDDFYHKASQALFCEMVPLPEKEPHTAQAGFPEPVSDLKPIVDLCRHLLSRLLPRLLRREEGVSELTVTLVSEEQTVTEQSLSPSFPTADADWVIELLRLRLERYFQRHPLRWGERIERVGLTVVGEPDPEKQTELFSGWECEGEETAPRDRESALWVLSRVRAEYGQDCLREAVLQDHTVPGRDFDFSVQQESQAMWGHGRPRSLEEELPPDKRVRRYLSTPLAVSRRDRWADKEGPYILNGGWWESQPFSRHYFFAREGAQTGWLYTDEQQQRWFAQGWLQ